MPIAFSKYVSITSVVGGNPPIQPRSLGGVIITENVLVPTQTLLVFESLADVDDYFGTAGEEYARAKQYFGFIGKQNTTPQTLGYWRWTNAAVAPLIFGATGTYTLSQFTPITAGTFVLDIGGVSNTVDVNFGSDGSLTAVAATLQAAIRAAGSGSGTVWTGATVAWDSTTGQFNFAGGGAGGVDTISVTDGAETPATILGWTGPGAIFSNGSAAETDVQTMTNLLNTSNNFGSFVFMNGLVTLTNVENVATWNAEQNVEFLYCQGVSAANASAWSAALIGIEGVQLTLDSGVTGQFHAMIPMQVLAATDYTQVNAAQNYMFQSQSTLTPSVTDTPTSNSYDALRVNYLGQTQDNGSNVAFYQRGVMMGGVTSPQAQNVYVNEEWLKSAIATTLANWLFTVKQVPTNNAGRASAMSQILSVVDNSTTGQPGAVQNGVIEAGKQLTAAQITAVTSDAGGNATAWQQVQTIGYWLNVVFANITNPNNNLPEKQMQYTLIYSKDDTVNSMTGTNVLI
jgi:hypothetical protein